MKKKVLKPKKRETRNSMRSPGGISRNTRKKQHMNNAALAIAQWMN